MPQRNNPEEFTPQVGPRWEKFDPAMTTLVERVADKIDHADSPAHAEKLVTKLNKKLDTEGLIGATVRLSSAIPIIIEEVITESDVEKRSVFDPEISGKEYFEGSFSGCSLIKFDDTEGQFITYDVTTLTNRGFLLVRSVSDLTRMEISKEAIEEDEDDSEVMLAGAFSVLESVPDEDYVDAVEALRSAFEDFDQPAIIRVKQIGFFAAILLASPEHIKHTARMTALDVVLKYSYDDELEYVVGGYREYDRLDSEFNSHIRVTGPEAPERGVITGVKYLSDFEIIHVDEDGPEIKGNDNLQPVFIVKFLNTDVEYEYPMRFLSRFEEYQHASGDELEQLIGPVAFANLRPSCGDEIRDFWAKVQAGQISMGKVGLDRHGFGD